MREVVVAGLARTPIGSFQGALADQPAPRLGSIAIREALQRAHVPADQVGEVVFGNVLAAGVGQAPARQAAIHAGLPKATPALTINKVCGSGMKAVMLGMQSIQAGDSEIVVAGGMENMSQAPYLAPGARAGLRLGNATLVDSMVNDGLWDPYSNQHMGNCAELCAREKGFSRQQQDEYAIQSFRRAQEAQKAGMFSWEIAPVEIAGKKETTRVDKDEGPGKAQFEKIPTLRPVFDKNGTVTAANASTINDGAAALVLCSAEKSKALGLSPVARLVAAGSFAQAPEWFTTAPGEAMRRAMKKAGWTPRDVDLWEVNEAFAVVALAAQKELEIPTDRFNAWGGAIALGHPIGASGARILCTLIAALRNRGVRRGVAGICIGGGEATALCVELA